MMLVPTHKKEKNGRKKKKEMLKEKQQKIRIRPSKKRSMSQINKNFNTL